MFFLFLVTPTTPVVLQKKVLFGYKHYHYNDHVSMDLSGKTSMERFFDRVVQNAEWYGTILAM